MARRRCAGTDKNIRAIQKTMREARLNGDNEEMRKAFAEWLSLDPWRKEVQTRVNRLPKPLRKGAVLTVAGILRLNIDAISAPGADLDQELRYAFFMATLCSPHKEVQTAFSRGQHKKTTSRQQTEVAG